MDISQEVLETALSLSTIRSTYSVQYMLSRGIFCWYVLDRFSWIFSIQVLRTVLYSRKLVFSIEIIWDFGTPFRDTYELEVVVNHQEVTGEPQQPS